MGTYTDLAKLKTRPKSPEKQEEPEIANIQQTEVRSSKPTIIHENRSDERFSERSEFRTEYQTSKVFSSLPLKRSTKRYSFEFYEDQLAEIMRLELHAKMSGKNISKSAIVRAALDAYLFPEKA
jgi:hypothetical protein